MEQENSLEQVLNEGQVSGEEVSETKDKPEEKKGEEEKVEISFSPEQETEIGKRLQSQRDIDLNPYREKREADIALIQNQQSRIKELTSKEGVNKLSKAMEAVLAGDEEAGIEPDKTETRRKAWNEVEGTIKDYKEKAAEVMEVATLASALADKVDKRVADNFNLFDSNPAVRAKGAIEAISDAVHLVNERAAFNRILDEIPLLKNGEEVRKQIDGFVESYMELSDQKGRDLLINQIKQEFRVTPRKKPPALSDVSGGGHLSDSPEDKVTRGLDKLTKRN